IATFWFEFQPSEGYHGASLIIGRKISVRPDIVFIKGEIEYYLRSQALLDKIYDKNIIIECKEEEYNEWSNKISKQISDYRELYKPKYLIVVSFKDSPKIKDADETFSNLRPDNKEEIERFKNYIRDIL
ncbi:MAG: hypothetical protein ACP5G1_04445, partial [Nanopusillaceae archaeon]